MNKALKSIGLGAACLLASSLALAEPDAYRIDDSHSFVNWNIRHVASKTSGTFSDVKGKVMIDRDHLEKSSVEAKISLLSVNSSHIKRDEHIKKSEYLDVEKFAEATFVSSKVVAKSNDEGVITGNFTLHGVTKEISFPFKVLGFGADPWGGFRMGLEGHTALKASDYGFAWGTKPDAPIGDEVVITLFIEAVKLPATVKLN